MNSSDVFTAVHQESLHTDSKDIFNITTQGHELFMWRYIHDEYIATSSDEWWLEVYGLANGTSTASLDADSMSEVSDDAVIPKRREMCFGAQPLVILNSSYSGTSCL